MIAIHFIQFMGVLKGVVKIENTHYLSAIIRHSDNKFNSSSSNSLQDIDVHTDRKGQKCYYSFLPFVPFISNSVYRLTDRCTHHSLSLCCAVRIIKNN